MSSAAKTCPNDPPASRLAAGGDLPSRSRSGGCRSPGDASCSTLGQIRRSPVTLADEAYERAVEVLRQNVTPLGFKASAELYDAVWARDAGVAVLGALLTGRDDLKEASRRTLEALAEAQSELGQIPNWRDATGRRNYSAPDATAWWVIAVARLGSDAGEDGLSAGLLPSVQRALTWLRYQAIDASGLLHSPPAADWMDSSLQRWGKVFYVNVLYWAALKAAGALVGSGTAADPAHERGRPPPHRPPPRPGPPPPPTAA